MTLKVEDTGRALIGALMGGTDVSWLQSISLDSNISIKDGVEAIVSSVLLNDNKLCDFNVYMDLANMMEYIQIPELSDSYMKAPVSSDSEENSEEAQQFLEHLYDDTFRSYFCASGFQNTFYIAGSLWKHYN